MPPPSRPTRGGGRSGRDADAATGGRRAMRRRTGQLPRAGRAGQGGRSRGRRSRREARLRSWRRRPLLDAATNDALGCVEIDTGKELVEDTTELGVLRSASDEGPLDGGGAALVRAVMHEALA